MDTQYIATRSLLEIYKAEERNHGAWVGMRWWEQTGIDLGEARETEATEKYGLGE